MSQTILLIYLFMQAFSSTSAVILICHQLFWKVYYIVCILNGIDLHLVRSAYSIFRYAEWNERIETTLMSVRYVQGHCHRLVHLAKPSCGRQRPTGNKASMLSSELSRSSIVSSLCAKLSICWLNLDCESGISVHLQIFSKNYPKTETISFKFLPASHLLSTTNLYIVNKVSRKVDTANHSSPVMARC